MPPACSQTLFLFCLSGVQFREITVHNSAVWSLSFEYSLSVTMYSCLVY